jgi:regulator of sigma E protease
LSLFWAVFLLGVLIFAHELGHFILAKLVGVKVLRFSLGFGPRVVGFRKGETEYLLSAVPFGGYVKMLGEEPGEELPPRERARAYSAQPLYRRVLIVGAGPVFNFLLAYLIFVMVLLAALPVNVPNLGDLQPQVGQVQKGSPAERAGLKPGDVIVEVQGSPVHTWFELVALTSARPGKETAFKVRRGQEEFTVLITPKAVKVEGPEGRERLIGRIGIMKAGGPPFYSYQARGPFSAFWVAAKATVRLCAFVLQVLERLITGAFSLKTIGGPIAIVQESGKAAALGLAPYLMFMAFISVNLGVLNLLPIPVLDGGHLGIMALEALRGRPLKERTQMALQKLGLAIILAIMVLALHNDLMRLLGGGR